MTETEMARLQWRIRQLAHQLDQLRIERRQLAALRDALERLRRKEP
jgi:hypothetical protein